MERYTKIGVRDEYLISIDVDRLLETANSSRTNSQSTPLKDKFEHFPSIQGVNIMFLFIPALSSAAKYTDLILRSVSPSTSPNH